MVAAQHQNDRDRVQAAVDVTEDAANEAAVEGIPHNPDASSRVGQPSQDSSDSNHSTIALITAWLRWQCEMIAGVRMGAVIPVNGNELSEVRAYWPEQPTDPSPLLRTAAKALSEGAVVVESQQWHGSEHATLTDVIGVPIHQQETGYIVVVVIESRSQSQQQAVVQLLQWGGVWLGTMEGVSLQHSDTVDPGHLPLLEVVNRAENSHHASVQLVNRLAADLGCERVSIGYCTRLDVRITAISQLAGFESGRSFVRLLESAMVESVDQVETISLPAWSDQAMEVVSAHRELERQNGNMAILTIPLKIGDQAIGAVMFERKGSMPFSADTGRMCERLLASLAPALQLHRESERSPFAQVASVCGSAIRLLFKFEDRRGTLIRIGSVLALLTAFALPVEHRVTATAMVQGADRQVLVAPYAGYVRSAHARAGDSVSAGQLLASVDDNELQIERQKWRTEIDKLETSIAAALAERNRTEIGLLQARKEQAQAEISLVEQRLSKAELHAPFDGVLISGDLSQSLGAPVNEGDVLFEISSLQDYRLILEFDEHAVSDVETGLSGRLRFPAQPDNSYSTTIKSVVPIAVSRDFRTVFQVEALLNDPATGLRPGMQGVAKVTVGRKPLFWVLSQRLLNRIRVAVWSIGL